MDRLAEFNRYRGLLFSIAYRMLSSVADAEDILQEAFLRWHRAPDAEIQSPRAFLVTIVSRLCINHLQSARVQREEYVGQWLPEPIVTEIAGPATFYPAEGYHQEYFERNGGQPYCQFVVAPKVAKFRKEFVDRLKR